MGRAHNDESGWKRGLGHYTASNPGLNRKSDDGTKAAHEVSYVMDDIGVGEHAGYRSNQWKVGALPRGGEPRYAPKGDSGTKSPEAASPSGKYAKPGGRGQRSGA